MLTPLATGAFENATVWFASEGGDPPADLGPVLVVQDRAGLTWLGRDELPVGHICRSVGATSHLAVVSRARGMFCAAVPGGALADGWLTIGTHTLQHGEQVSLGPEGLATPRGTIPVARPRSMQVASSACMVRGLDLYCTAPSVDELASSHHRGASVSAASASSTSWSGRPPRGSSLRCSRSCSCTAVTARTQAWTPGAGWLTS
ncbi:hypothetical protein [Nocardioides sp. InS609-2]|uniref:hypothetical protein n=1 Tax=Nocardioides sp. InS609-2 TaxID=2760705 RepID=UPI001819068A|nr:hypothetical protein [Nocardioides sp. InS609-2]MBA3782432.1 hypothetical protein [Nocardioides sp.]